MPNSVQTIQTLLTTSSDSNQVNTGHSTDESFDNLLTAVRDLPAIIDIERGEKLLSIGHFWLKHKVEWY